MLLLWVLLFLMLSVHLPVYTSSVKLTLCLKEKLNLLESFCTKQLKTQCTLIHDIIAVNNQQSIKRLVIIININNFPYLALKGERKEWSLSFIKVRLFWEGVTNFITRMMSFLLPKYRSKSKPVNCRGFVHGTTEHFQVLIINIQLHFSCWHLWKYSSVFPHV